MKQALQTVFQSCLRLWRRPSVMRDTFAEIYRTNAWGNDQSRSGPGSTVARTAALRPQLERLLQELQIETMLDAPCGDFNWLKESVLPVRQYIGVDVVPNLVRGNQGMFGNQQRQFRCLDMTCARLPRADLILCRDGLVHLSFADIFRTLERFRQSGARYLLATTFPSWRSNDDIATGAWRPLNLQAPPFSWQHPIRLLDDAAPASEYRDKSLGLWRIGD